MINSIFTVMFFLLIIAGAFIVGKFLGWKQTVTQTLQANSNLIETKAGVIEYQIHGAKGDFILFIHGSPGGYDQYQPERNSVFRDYRVVSISRPGYLRTPLSTGKTIEEQADALAAFLDALNIEQVIITGGSGGGPLSLLFAAKYPKRTRALILYAPVSQAISHEPKQKATRLLKKVMVSDFASWLFVKPMIENPERLIRALVSGIDNQLKILSNSSDKKHFAEAMHAALPPSLRNPGLHNDEQNFKTLDLPSKLITAPTLIFHGDEDAHVPFEQSESLNQQVPHSMFVKLEGGDHFAIYTHKITIDKATRTFLDGLILKTIKGPELRQCVAN